MLVIDDNRDFAEIVAGVGRDAGFAVAVTANAEDFRESFQASRPEVVVLDLVMPETDGIELMRWLVDRGYAARVVIVTGFSPVYARAAEVLGKQSGGMQISILQKPFKLDELRKALTDGRPAKPGKK